jgi:hypothetical protein
MGEGSDQIARDIERTRDELGSDLNELERRVKNATNWRKQFQQHPFTMMGVAFGGGLLLSQLWGSNSGSRTVEQSSSTMRRRTRGFWEAIRGPLISIAAARVQRALQ